MFPRELSSREFAWITWLLPEDRPGYHRFRKLIQPLFVIGEGRWGAQDFVLGPIGGMIDHTEGMRPVVAFGTIHGDTCDVTLSLHEPNDEGLIEFQLGTSTNGPVPFDFRERSRWTYSTWSPGDLCPATGAAVREVVLATGTLGTLRLAISPGQRVIWLHNENDRTNTLVPISGFYNELVIAKRIRDPKVALNHRLLFTQAALFNDADIVEAFVRYNVLYRKVNVGVFDPPPQRQTLLKRLFGRKSS